VDCNLQIPTQLRDAKLIDIVDDDGLWNWQLLDTWLPNDIMGKIAALLPPHAIGIFSISDMYHAICGFDGDETGGIWTMIWRLKEPERVRAFVWLVKHGRLLTNERKHCMGLGSDRCDYCCDCTETIIHVLRDCALIRPLWISAVDTAVRHQFFTSNLEDLIVINISCKGGISFK
jgi:hypothetical protein